MSTTDPNGSDDGDWKADDWESARHGSLTLALDATPAERLAWLKEAIRLAVASGALRRGANPRKVREISLRDRASASGPH